MIPLAKILAAGLLAAPLVPHALDRPKVDLTVEARAQGLRVQMLMNFQFLDAALGTKGEPTAVPTQAELDALRGRLEALFVERPIVRIDGAKVAPQLTAFECAPPPKELRDREPQLSRKVTQVRFFVNYDIGRQPGAVQLQWHWFPEHAIYDVANSPVAPMQLQAVVLRGDKTPDVHPLTVTASECALRFGDGSDAAAGTAEDGVTNAPTPAAAPPQPAAGPRFGLVTMLLGSLGALLLVVFFATRSRS